MSMVMKLLRKIKRYFTDKRNLDSKVLAHMKTVTSARPLSINLETVTVCNSKCCFCGYPKVTRKYEVMPLELYENILDNYMQFGGGPLGFSPLMSDPLLDPFIIQRIKLANQAKYKFWLHLFTNAIGFSKFPPEELQEFSTLKRINISMGGPDREGYFSMYKVDCFDQVVANVEKIRNVLIDSDADTKISIHFRVVNVDELRKSELYRRFVDYGFDCTDIANTFSSFAGLVSQNHVPSGVTISEPHNENNTIDCVIPYTTSLILANGDVAMCSCFGYSGVTIAGNLYENNILDIWKNYKYEDFRHSFSQRTCKEICKSCGMYIPATSILGNKGLKDYDPCAANFWEFLESE